MELQKHPLMITPPMMLRRREEGQGQGQGCGAFPTAASQLL